MSAGGFLRDLCDENVHLQMRVRILIGKIAHLAVRGFKSFKDAQFDITDRNVVIGINGSEKSNLLEVFEFVRNVRSGHLQLYVGKAGSADKLLYMGAHVTRDIYIRIEYTNFTYVLALSYTKQNSLVISEEKIEIDGNTYVVSPSGSSESKLEGDKIDTVDYSWLKQDVREALKEQMKFFVFHFSDVGHTSKLGKPADMNDNRTLRPDGSNLNAILFRIHKKSPDTLQRMEFVINQAAPYFKEFSLRKDPLNEQMVLFEWRHRAKDNLFDFSDLSDGTKRLIGILTTIYQEEHPSLIIIDEPEIGLHPKALVLLAEVIIKASEHIKFIFSMQSPRFLTLFDEWDVIVNEYSDDQSVLKRLDPEGIRHWIEDYDLGELWETNVIGGRP